VLIDDRGPFNLIVDTASNGSAVTAEVARAIGRDLDEEPGLMMHGAVGSITTPAILVRSISLNGAPIATTARVPIVAEHLAGADGFLGVSGRLDYCVTLDFKNDSISLAPQAPGLRADCRITEAGLDLSHVHIPILSVRVGEITTQAILATGVPESIGNCALHWALQGPRAAGRGTSRAGFRQTPSRRSGRICLPGVKLGDSMIKGIRVSIDNASIFAHLNIADAPALLLGMDIIGQFAAACFDYPHKTLRLWSS
jgi:hypothetical protein